MKQRLFFLTTLGLVLSLLVACGDEASPSSGIVVINEVFVKSSEVGNSDWIEIFNNGQDSAALGGWLIKDSKDRDPFTIPGGTTIGVKGYYVVGKDPDGLTGFTFGLGKADSVRLFDGEGALVDTVSWEDNSTLEDKSLGRLPDGTGEFTTLGASTKSTANK